MSGRCHEMYHPYTLETVLKVQNQEKLRKYFENIFLSAELLIKL